MLARVLAIKYSLLARTYKLMPIKRCHFGFSCAAMMMTPGLIADDCPNQQTCGTFSEYTPEERVELIRVRREREQIIRETIRCTQRQAAAMMLLQRGCPQTVESLGVSEALAAVELRLTEVRSHLARFENQYIAPTGSETHRYNVKRGYATYWYNKLTSESSIFEPSVRQGMVRVIHLSHDDDPRNLEARQGIERRNKLLSLRSQLRQIEQILIAVLANN